MTDIKIVEVSNLASINLANVTVIVEMRNEVNPYTLIHFVGGVPVRVDSPKSVIIDKLSKAVDWSA